MTTATSIDVDALAASRAQEALARWLELRLGSRDRRALARFVCTLRQGAGGVLVIAGHPARPKGSGHVLLEGLVRRAAPSARQCWLHLVNVQAADGAEHEARLACLGRNAERCEVVGRGVAAAVAMRSGDGLADVLGLMPASSIRNPHAVVVSYEGLAWDTPPEGLACVTLRRPTSALGRWVNDNGELARMEIHARNGDLAKWARDYTGG